MIKVVAISFFLLVPLILSGCGSFNGFYNPYEQDFMEAVAPDMLEVVGKRNNVTDQISGTDVRLRWLLK